ncbi:hypothetical protein T01_7791 [Trichinella spiralis]|uniref:Uncharacterized protein n=1 Tax=Trichinella spiralis TaxID=6334 RepID=A0A0V1BX78_TRISP|nr:hypothetical protein T01_7791 [Trichinella spiralis]
MITLLTFQESLPLLSDLWIHLASSSSHSNTVQCRKTLPKRNSVVFIALCNKNVVKYANTPDNNLNNSWGYADDDW